MGEYSAGIATKARILQVCKELFYAYGLEDTTYKMICDKAEINRGLLPYHFRSKYNIARTIYDSFLQQFEGWMDQIYRDVDYVERFAASCLVLYRFIYSNRNFMRFYCDLKTCRDLKPYITEIQTKTIRKIVSACAIEISDEEIRTLSCMYCGVESELITNSYNGFITEDVEAIAVKDLLFVLSMLKFDSVEIKHIVHSAAELSQPCNITMVNGFAVEFRYVK